MHAKVIEWINRRNLLLHLLPLVLTCCLGAGIALIAGQDQNWDLFNYHYYNAFAFLHHRQYFDFAPAGIQTFNNPLLDLVPYVLISHFLPIIAGTILGALQGLNAWLVYEIALVALATRLRAFQKYSFAFVIAIFSFFGAANLSEIGGTMGDNTTSIMVLLGLLLILKSNHGNFSLPKYKAMKFIGYVIVGLAAGVKLTNAPYAVAIMFVEIANWRSFVSFIKQSFYNGLGLFLGVLMGDGFWAYYLYKRFGNPIFPYYNHFFRSPDYPGINFVDARFFPHGVNQWLFYPFYFLHKQHLAAEVFYRDPRLAVLYAVSIILMAALLVKRWTGKRFLPLRNLSVNKETASLFLFVTISYVLWEKEFSIYRYIVPIEFLSLLLIALVIGSLFRKVRPWYILTVLFFAFIAARTSPMNWGRIAWQPTFFGVQLPYPISNNSVLLMADDQPVSFVIPFFPRKVPAVRIDSTVSSYLDSASPLQQSLRRRISQYKLSGTQFYGVETMVSGQEETLAYISYGLKPEGCSNLNYYFAKYSQSYFLCKLSY